MFEHKIPKFTPGRVLSREILFTMRDLAYQEQSVRYDEYCDGIIEGCALYEEDMKIGIQNGLIKFGGRLYLLTEKQGIPYQPTDEWTMLKIRFGTQLASKDFTHYTGELVLDNGLRVQANEMELGRFKLKKGSRLRTQYISFADMETEYDTVNLLHVVQSAPGEPTISPKITRTFAQEAFPFVNDPMDISFCSICLGAEQAVRRDYIQWYICGRMNTDYQHLDNLQIHRSLKDILEAIRTGSPLGQRKRPSRHTILLD